MLTCVSISASAQKPVKSEVWQSTALTQLLISTWAVISIHFPTPERLQSWGDTSGHKQDWCPSVSIAYVASITQPDTSCSEIQDILHMIVKIILIIPIYPLNFHTQITRGETPKTFHWTRWDVVFLQLQWETPIYSCDKLSHTSDLAPVCTCVLKEDESIS